MKKMRKGKKMLLILIIAILVILAVTVIVSIIKKVTETPGQPEKPAIIQLPDTTYSNMQVKNIQMEHLKEGNETVVTFEIHNTTDAKVADQHFDAYLIGADENVLAEMQTYIQELEVGQQHRVSVIFAGDLTATTQIKLLEK